MVAKKTPAGEKPAERAPVPALDLSAFDLQAEAERGATMPVLNPKTGAPTGATISVYGQDARGYRVAARRIADEIAANFEREPTDPDDALLLGRAREAAAAITDWDGIVVDGEVVDCTIESAVEVLRRYPWLADQVLTFIRSRGNFSAA